MTTVTETRDVERTVLDLVGRAMGQFSMLRPGDRVAVGVSGGKDSLCLLHALVAHKQRCPLVLSSYAQVTQHRWASQVGTGRQPEQQSSCEHGRDRIQDGSMDGDPRTHGAPLCR